MAENNSWIPLQSTPALQAIKLPPFGHPDEDDSPLNKINKIVHQVLDTI